MCSTPYFFAVTTRLRRENALFHVLYGGRKQAATKFSFFFFPVNLDMVFELELSR